MNVVEPILASVLDKFTASDLENAIKDNYDLVDLTSMDPFTVKTLRGLAVFYPSAKKQITYDVIIKFIKEKRPDLYKVIEANPNGHTWLRENTERLRRFFFG